MLKRFRAWKYGGPNILYVVSHYWLFWSVLIIPQNLDTICQLVVSSTEFLHNISLRGTRDARVTLYMYLSNLCFDR